MNDPRLLSNGLYCEIKKGNELTEAEQNALWLMLLEYEKEFVPPISERGGDDPEQNLKDYFQMLMNQEFILLKDPARSSGEIAAFLSYVPKKWYEYTQGYVTYMSTAIVLHEYRGRHCLNLMYEEVFRIASYPPATRTWSTHAAQLHLLPKLGFRVVETVKDDRGPGVDSLYFVRDSREGR